ncbi:MAG TPA: gas vesicle protein GvpD P-loop domain-containing protein [Nitrososphaeraceae archaeon]|jgi:KaiC/GvpD/RAD55 family RecA-like ATPase
MSIRRRIDMENRVYSGNYSFLDIPFELREFMKNDTYSLLVKGPSGSGKTTLSLSLLRSLKQKNNFFYISTRSSPKQLFEHYPWLRKIIKPPKKDIDSQDVGQNLSSFEDARLDEPESLFERVTNQLMDVKNPVIIIDSWDSVASLMDREARLNNERVLQTWRERAKAKLIFTSEDSVESNLEFIVDGVIELNYQFMDEIRIRSLFLKKLRGIQIKRSLYHFTLKDRILRCLDSYDPRQFRIHNTSEKIPNVTNFSKQILQTGYQDLDKYIGSLPQGGLITIERDNSLSDDIVLLFLSDILFNFSKMNYCLLLDSSIKDDLILTYKSNIQSYGKLYALDGLGSTENLKQKEINSKDVFYKYVAKIVSSLEGKEKIVNLMGSLSLEIFKPSSSDIEDFCRFIKNKFELSILILNSTHNLEKYYSASDIRLKFILICGTLFLKCTTPSSALFGIRVVNSVPQIQLDHVL